MRSRSGIWSKTRQLVELATKLTIIGVPVLYFMGWIYLEAYWAKFGISETLLGFTATDYLRSGAFVLMLSIVRGSPWVLSIALICTVLVVLLVLIRMYALPKLFAITRRTRLYLATVRKEAWKNVSPKHRRLALSLGALGDSITAGVISFLAVLLFLIGTIFVGISPSRTMAEENADKTMRSLNRFASTEQSWVLAYAEEASNRPALVVQCTGEACVLMAGERFEVLPRTAIIKLETCRKVGRSDSGTFHCIKARPT